MTMSYKVARPLPLWSLASVWRVGQSVLEA